MKLSQFSQFKQNATRFQEIVAILSKYGLANWIKEKDPDFLNGLFTDASGKSFAGLSHAIRLRMALTELGTTFIKLGQMLSTRADLIGPEVAEELCLLQSEVPSDSESTVRTVIEDELAAPLETIFSNFNFTPLGSASIGQVHAATLQTGEQVVVKVQHAGIEEKIRADIEILGLLVTLAEKYDAQLQLYRPKSLLKDFANNLLKELDYNKELNNIALFKNYFKDHQQIHIPDTYDALSGQKVLVMERLKGVSIGDKSQLKCTPEEGKVLAKIGVNLYLDMIFKYRVFHADPHPGNIWVLPGDQLGLLDFGMIGRLDDNLHEAIENMLMAVSQKDVVEVTHQITTICSVPKGFDRQQLQEDVGEFIFEYFSSSLDSVNVTEMLNCLTGIIRAHHLVMPTGISLLIRVLVLLEGSSQLLDRSFSFNDAVVPYTHKMRMRRLNPKRVAKKLGKSLSAWERLLSALPADLETLMSQMRSGDFDVNLKHRHLDAVVNRLVYGVLTGSMLLGGSMLLSSKAPPLINNISILGAGLVGGAVVLGYKLLNAISKSGSLVDSGKR
ncbi:hypothetical protein CW745_09440 [Psychromonas sp. psych-6C06]|uniref:ABC1 kinase family protein n=1 Tax=Psychromonas sp. psych-6C06 TaxID=2058089 RepID=UPI000C33023F|nr:AarF/UbiB family protein [Psychromonas sp. psych-6C06]PKF61547.1 hypothetical protein CW745_09440 [Psychromonas sp. psych-6C06]